MRYVAQTLSATLLETDLVTCYGDEEFGIVFPHTTATQAKDILARACMDVEMSRYPFEGLRLRLTLSMGVVQVLHGEYKTEFVDRTDAALYTSKQAGQNCSYFHNGVSCEHFGAELSKVSDMCPDDDSHQSEDAYTDTATQLPSRKVVVEELRRRVLETGHDNTHLSMRLVELKDFEELKRQDQETADKAMHFLGEFIRYNIRDIDLLARHEQNQLALMMPYTLFDKPIIPA